MFKNVNMIFNFVNIFIPIFSQLIDILRFSSLA